MKMKKRRELDALVNGKLGRRKMKKGHELLRNDTDSSEVEEFSMPEKTIIRKRSASRLCSMCIPVCGFFLLTACIVAIGGLVFVHIELKKDLDDLRMQINRVASGSQDNPDKFQQIHSSMQELTKSITTLKDGFKKGKVNISKLEGQFIEFRTATEKLTKSVAAAPQLTKLPQKVEDLSKNVAMLGSNLKALQGNVDGLVQFKTKYAGDHETMLVRIKKLEAAMDSQGPQHIAGHTGGVQMDPSKALKEYLHQELTRVHRDIDRLNSSMSSHMSQINVAVVRVNKLVNESELVKQRLALLELQPAATGAPSMSVPANLQTIIQEAVNSVLNQSSAGADTVGVTRIHNQVNNITSVLQQLRTKVDKLKSSGASQAGAGALVQVVSSLKDVVSTNTLNIKTVNASVNELTVSMATMTKEMQSHQSKISRLELKEPEEHVGPTGKALPPSGGNTERKKEPNLAGSPSTVSQPKQPQSTNIDNEQKGQSSFSNGGPSANAGQESNSGPSGPLAQGPQRGGEPTGPAGQGGENGQPGQAGTQGQGRSDVHAPTLNTMAPGGTGRDSAGSPGTQKQEGGYDRKAENQNGQQGGLLPPATVAQGPTGDGQTGTNSRNPPPREQQAGQNARGPDAGQLTGQRAQTGKANWNSQNDQKSQTNQQTGVDAQSNQQTGNSPRNQQSNAPRNQESSSPRHQESNTPRNQESNAPRNQESNAPRNQEGNNPRNQESNAPRNQESNTPRNQKNNKESQTNGQASQGKSSEQPSLSDPESKPKQKDKRKRVSVPFIHDEKTLETHFHRWDSNDGDDKIHYEDMRGFLGPNMPKEEVLKLYDADHDGYYTLEEMKQAFGFAPQPTPTQKPASGKNSAPNILPKEDRG